MNVPTFSLSARAFLTPSIIPSEILVCLFYRVVLRVAAIPFESTRIPQSKAMRMEVRRNPCVLPSNAPALESKADCPIGVLRTSSGNVLSSSLDSRRRPFKATSAHHTGVRASRAFDDAQSRFGSSARQSAQRQRQKKVPDDVFPILNGEELQSPKYLVYRERQRREEGTDGKQVWSDELEVAFQTGPFKYYPTLGFLT